MSPVDATTLQPSTPLASPSLGEDPPRALGGVAGDAPFRRLLERLEALAQAPAAPVADAEDLQQALRRADDDFVVAMDLRRRLEDAVRGGG